MNINICNPPLIYSVMQTFSQMSLIAPLNTCIDSFEDILNVSGYTCENNFESV